MTALPPPPRGGSGDEDRLHRGAALFILLGLAAWFGAFGAIAGISEQDADKQITYLAAAIVLSVVGSTFLIVAVLYEIANRRRP